MLCLGVVAHTVSQLSGQLRERSLPGMGFSLWLEPYRAPAAFRGPRALV